MDEATKPKKVRTIPVRLVSINPKNPRLIFDQEKLDNLCDSIRQKGILVPISVYIDGKTKKFVLIDGERRYRCALKIGIKEIPAITYERPTDTEYTLDMFHMHHLREPWELIPTAIKLDEVSQWFKKQNDRLPTEKELKKLTRLSISEIRRCKLILGLPPEVQDLILEEEAKTSTEKKVIGKDKLLTEDFFIEVSKNFVNPLKNSNRKAYDELGEDKKIFDSLITKRRNGLISNIVTFRPVGKYIRDHPNKSAKEIKNFIKNENYSLDKLIISSGLEFDLYKFKRNIKIFIGSLEKVPSDLETGQKSELLRLLRQIKKEIDKKIVQLRR